MTLLPARTVKSGGNPVSVSRFNPSQLRALDLDHHVAVTAAAGSGKTTVLVERFVRVLEKNGFRPEQIVALTFTEEAASQMRTKIRGTLMARASQWQDEGKGSDNPWQRSVSQLAAARITTIHGFCASLLQEHSREAAFGTGFYLASPGQQQALLGRSVEEGLDRLSRSGCQELATLLEYRSAESIRQTLLELVLRRNYLGRIETGKAGRDKLLEIYRRETAGHLIRSPGVEQLRQTLALVPTYLLAEGGSWSDRCRTQQALFSRRNRLDPEAFMHQLQASLRGSVRPTRRWSRSSHYLQLRDRWSELRTLFRKRPLDLPAASESEERHYEAAVQSLRFLYAEILQEYSRAKQREAVLDFDDLLEQAGELVRVPEVRESLRDRYRYFLVDEFQDTNWVQWQLLKPLLGARANFMAVGDAKQSIYRFRDADVSIFGRVQNWIENRGKLVNMPQNYRSSPPLVDYLNGIFGRLFDPLFEYEAAHQEMESLRSGKTADAPAVQACFLDGPDTDEASAASAWISRLLQVEQVRPEQIAVLLRTRTRLREYEAALKDAGIPFRTVGGSGFFQRQEIKDLVLILKFLADPTDSVSLVGVLRSRFFSFSDEDLFEIARNPGSDFWEKLREGSRRRAKKRPHWVDSVVQLQEWLLGFGIAPLAETVNRIIGQGGYTTIASQSAECPRVLANVDKFLQLAADFEREGRSTPRRFLRLLDSLLASDSNEPEAPSDETCSGAVSIYTIHGAKGLQFPVVMLPDLGAPFAAAPSDRFYTHTFQDQGEVHSCFGLKIRNPDNQYKELEHPVFEALRCLSEYRQLAEEKRLLYVAMTRAEERLLLLGRRDTGPSYAQWLLQCGPRDHQVSPAHFEEWLGGRRPNPAKLNPDTPIGDGESPIVIEAGQPPNLQHALDKLTWTPTEIVRLRHCPRKFYWSDVEARLEEDPLTQLPPEGEAALMGSAVHDLLDRVALRGDESLRQRETVRWASRLSSRLGDSVERFERILGAHLRNFESSRLARRMRDAVRVYSEKAFTLHDPAGFILRGAIDKLLQNPDGTWTVVDFKTNYVPQEGVGMLPHYRRQVELYLWAMSKMLSTDQLKGLLFFTYNGESVPVVWSSEVQQRCQALLARLPRGRDRALYPKTDDAAFCRECGYLKTMLCPGA